MGVGHKMLGKKNKISTGDEKKGNNILRTYSGNWAPEKNKAQFSYNSFPRENQAAYCCETRDKEMTQQSVRAPWLVQYKGLVLP